MVTVKKCIGHYNSTIHRCKHCMLRETCMIASIDEEW